MRVAIDTRSLRPPLNEIGHFVHRLSDAMVPLLSPDQELLAFTGWGTAPLDHNFVARIEALNSGRASGDSGLSSRRLAGTGSNFLRQLKPARQP